MMANQLACHLSVRKAFLRKILLEVQPTWSSSVYGNKSDYIKTMLRSYLKIALRSLAKQKLFTFTNIIGLSIGVLCCLLILLYVNHEMSYERWNPNADRIVRTYGDINFGGTVMRMAVSGAPVAPDAAAAIPDIVDWCRMRNYGSYLVTVEGRSMQKMLVEEALTVDSTFFHLFPTPLVEGDIRSALVQPRKLVLSESLCNRLFATPAQAIGQQLLLDNQESPWEITGVFQDLPINTHFKADMLLAMNGNREVAESPPFWAANNNFHTYLLLREGTEYEDFSAKFTKLAREKMEITSSTLLGMSLEEFEATGQYAHYQLQRLPDIHLLSDLQVELQPNGDIKYVWIFSFIAFFVLIIACINFMNLTTAKAGQRSKEIGIRKVMGSERSQLVFQFLSEAIFIAFFAVLVAVLSAILLLPAYNNLTGVSLEMPWSNLQFWLALIGGTLLVGLLAGSYPSFFLSGFKPISVLRNSLSRKSDRDQLLRNGLVVFQFFIATSLIIGTFLIYRQLQYMQNKRLGFQKEQIVVVDDAYTLRQNITSYKQRILQNPAISAATISSYLPIPSSRSNSTYSQVRELREDKAINMDNWRVDYDYANAFQLNILEGRFFDRRFGEDSSAVVLNEAAIKVLGYDNPIGQKIYGLRDDIQSRAPQADDFQAFTIIGVVEDFHYESLRETIGSLGFFLGDSRGAVSVRYESGETEAVLSTLENTWNQMAVNQPFSYRFVDQSFAKVYADEQRIGKITMLFSILAIIVSCLGLFGLSTYVVEQRTKEIGIRKVLGASVTNIVSLLSRQFVWLVGLGIALAIPVTWIGLSKWLENYAYRTEVHWTVFVLAAFVALVIAILTVSLKSMQAAVSHPMQALRDE